MNHYCLLFNRTIRTQIQSQAVQFQEYLKGGFTAETNLVSSFFVGHYRTDLLNADVFQRFKREVQLAQDVATPLANGLKDYATILESRKK